MTRSRFKRNLIVLGLLILVLSLIPFPTTVVPDWEIRFVDENGSPVSGVNVEEVCQHYTFTEANVCAQYPDARQTTGADGFVRFSRKPIWLSAISRIFRSAFFHLTLLAHGSVGIEAYLVISVPMEYESIGLIRYVPDQLPPNNIVLMPTSQSEEAH